MQADIFLSHKRSPSMKQVGEQRKYDMNADNTQKLRLVKTVCLH